MSIKTCCDFFSFCVIPHGPVSTDTHVYKQLFLGYESISTPHFLSSKFSAQGVQNVFGNFNAGK
jgi:hypothetical protein